MAFLLTNLTPFRVKDSLVPDGVASERLKSGVTQESYPPPIRAETRAEAPSGSPSEENGLGGLGGVLGGSAFRCRESGGGGGLARLEFPALRIWTWGRFSPSSLSSHRCCPLVPLAAEGISPRTTCFCLFALALWMRPFLLFSELARSFAV